MKFSNLITIILFTVGCCSFESAAQSLLDSKPHAEIHKQLLANAKSSKLDKSVIKDFIKNDIEKREDSNIKNTSESTETITLINDLLKEANTHIGKRYRSGNLKVRMHLIAPASQVMFFASLVIILEHPHATNTIRVAL